MRVLLVNYEYPPTGGGAATATERIARAMVELGHEPTVLTGAFAEHRGLIRAAGVTVWRLPVIRRRADRSNIGEMATYIAAACAYMPLVVHRLRPQGCICFFSVPCGPVGWWASTIAGMPYVVSLRGGDVPGTEAGLDRMHRWLAPFRRWILRRATAVVANSPGLKRLSQAADPVAVRVIANGVDHERFRDPGRQWVDGDFRFVFVGRLNEQKNVGLLIEAFTRYTAEGHPPARLKIVGDGPLGPQLRLQAAASAAADRIEWLPWQSRERMPAILADADCLINPSLYEGMPNVVLEAMSCARPVIASEVAGNADIITSGTDGLLFRSGDLEALLAAMRRIASDGDLRTALGGAARARVVRDHSWQATAAAYLELLGLPAQAEAAR